MNRSCSTCGNLGQGALGYRCDAVRLRDPQDQLVATPTRTVAQPEAFAFGATNRSATEVQRSMSPGPIEGWTRRWQDGERETFEYRQSPCPAWRIA
jgi:hypothetical protein